MNESVEIFRESLRILGMWSTVLVSLGTVVFLSLSNKKSRSKIVKFSLFCSVASLLIGVNVIGTIPWSIQNIVLFASQYHDIYQFPNYFGIKIWFLAFSQHITFAISLIGLLIINMKSAN